MKQHTAAIFKIWYGVLLIVACNSCKHQPEKPQVENTINSGVITIYADNTYKILLDELIKSYQNIYTDAHITAVYLPENNVIENMMQDSVQMIFTSTELSDANLRKIEETQGVKPKQFNIAYDAIAVIASATYPDSVFDLDEFINSRVEAYSGKYKEYAFVFDQNKTSSIAKILQLNGNRNVSLTNMFALKNKEEVAEYVKNKSNSIGFISFAEISDRDIPEINNYLQNLKVLRVALSDSIGKKNVYEMSQSQLALKDYPLEKTIRIVIGNTQSRLGTGFVNFMYKSKASRVFLKAGLIPEIIPEREIEVNTDNFTTEN